MNTERKTRRDRRVFFCDGIQQDVFFFLTFAVKIPNIL